jgi:hypothetical protein
VPIAARVETESHADWLVQVINDLNRDGITGRRLIKDRVTRAASYAQSRYNDPGAAR